jgi:enoyl-[acyl-carrier protein] reductase II
MIKTRITELLGIEYPVIQGAMAWVSWPPLVAAVSNAGGLGILGSGRWSADFVQEQVREVKRLTEKPFGANVIPGNSNIDNFMDVMVAEKVPVVSYGKGNPQRIIERAKSAGLVAIPSMGAVRHAIRAEADGADAVVVQGTEAGGHASFVSTMVMVPMVVDRVKIPVVAAGGIGDARGLAAAMMLGAEGISMGTRFIVTQECPVPLTIKQRIMQASEEDTVVTDNLTGTRCRVLNNALARQFADMAARNVSPEEMMKFGTGKFRLAFMEGDDDNGTMAMGQVAGMINDLPTCKELIERVVNGAEEILERTRQRVLT